MIIYDFVSEKDLKKIFVQVNKFTTFDEYVKNASLDIVHRGVKKADNWNIPDIEWFRGDGKNIDRYKDPDMSYCDLGNILSPYTAELIKPVVEDVAELVPIKANDEIWYFLNVLNVVEAIDEENSEYMIFDDGSRGIVTKLEFLTDKVPHAQLFVVPGMLRIYYAEHQPDDNPNTFKNILEQNKLTGLSLRQIREY